MSKKKQKSIEELLEEALVPEEEQPYEVPENWVWTKVGDLVELERGITFPASAKKDQKEEGLIGCARTANVQDEFIWDDLIYVDKKYLKNNDKKLLRKDDIVMSTANSYHLVGKVSYIHKLIEPITFGGFIMSIRAKYPVNQKFLYYYFREQFLNGKIQKLASQTTNIANLNGEKIKSLSLPLPPLNEQKRIAEKIERLFAKIDEAKRLIEEVKESFEFRRAAILDKAFKGQLGTNDPNEKSMLETSNEIKEKDLIPKEEQPYEVPENWVWVNCGAIAEIVRGVSYKKDQVEQFKNANTSLVIRGGNIQEGKLVNQDDNVYVKNDIINENQRLQEKDVLLVSSTGSNKVIGKAASVTPEFVNESFGAFVTLLRPDKKINGDYFGFYFQSSSYKSVISNLAKGSNIKNIKKEHLQNLSFPLPPLNEQKRIADKVDNLLSNLENEQELVLEVEEKLNLLKQSILNKAFRGELGTNDPNDEQAIELLKEVLKSK